MRDKLAFYYQNISYTKLHRDDVDMEQTKTPRAT